MDTNVLAYAEGLGDGVRLEQALSVLKRGYIGHDLVFPAQVLAELFRVLVKTGSVSASDAQRRVMSWREKGTVAPTSVETLVKAFDTVVAHGLQPFDAIVLAAAGEAGCSLLVTEDMQDGFTAGGVTLVNPFADRPHPLLATL